MCLQTMTNKNYFLIRFRFPNIYKYTGYIANKFFKLDVNSNIPSLNSLYINYKYKLNKNKAGIKIKSDNNLQSIDQCVNVVNSINDFEKNNNIWKSKPYECNLGYRAELINIKTKYKIETYCTAKSLTYYHINIPIYFTHGDIQIIGDTSIIINEFTILSPNKLINSNLLDFMIIEEKKEFIEKYKKIYKYLLKIEKEQNKDNL